MQQPLETACSSSKSQLCGRSFSRSCFQASAVGYLYKQEGRSIFLIAAGSCSLLLENTINVLF